MWKRTTRYARCSGRNPRSRVDIDATVATRRRAGVAYIVASAVCFGAMAIMARFAYASGVDTTTLLALRFGIAAGILVAVALARGSWERWQLRWSASS
jgi:drug/metabolite transporter (DMT)-like permease